MRKTLRKQESTPFLGVSSAISAFTFQKSLQEAILLHRFDDDSAQ